MQKTALGFLLLALTISCYRKIPTTNREEIYTKFSLVSIKTDNLSEEITGNDEIQAMFWLMKDSIPVPYIIKEYQNTLNFTEKDLFQPKEILFEQNIINPERTYLIAVLVEADTEKSPEERMEQVRKNMQWANFHQHDSLQTKLYQDLLDDDLLGISFHKLSILNKNQQGELIFSGIHMFDKYFYRIKYKLE